MSNPFHTSTIQVLYDDGTVLTGEVTGYALPFAIITTKYGSFEASWETVKRCQDQRKPIRY